MDGSSLVNPRDVRSSFVGNKPRAHQVGRNSLGALCWLVVSRGNSSVCGVSLDEADQVLLH